MAQAPHKTDVMKPGPLLWISIVIGLTVSGCATPGRFDGLRSSQADADADFQKGADRPPTPRALYAMAGILAGQGRDAECEPVLRRIVREHPRFLPAYCDLAELALRHRRADDAIETLSAGLRLAPRDPILLNNLGMCWILKREYGDALGVFTRAAGIMPQDARYRANMAVSLGMMGRYEESLSLYQQVVPTPDAHHNLGVIRRARGDLFAAIRARGQAEAPARGPADPRGTRPRGRDAGTRPATRLKEANRGY